MCIDEGWIEDRCDRIPSHRVGHIDSENDSGIAHHITRDIPEECLHSRTNRRGRLYTEYEEIEVPPTIDLVEGIMDHDRATRLELESEGRITEWLRSQKGKRDIAGETWTTQLQIRCPSDLAEPETITARCHQNEIGTSLTYITRYLTRRRIGVHTQGKGTIPYRTRPPQTDRAPTD